MGHGTPSLLGGRLSCIPWLARNSVEGMRRGPVPDSYRSHTEGTCYENETGLVSPVPAVTGHELLENHRSITEIHRRQALRQLILSSFCFFVASIASAAEPGITDSSTLRDKADYFQQDLRDKHLLE